MVFITKYNASRISKKMDYSKLYKSNEKTYDREIYYLFNRFEKAELLAYKALMRDPEAAIDKYYLSIKEGRDNYQYVFKAGKPSYHSKKDCTKINSSYINYEIPLEIKHRGKEEIERFRRWFKANVQLLEEKPEYFYARLELNFKVRMPNQIVKENSGYDIFENLNLNELEARVNEHLDNIIKYYNETEDYKKNIIKKYAKYTYSWNKPKIILRNNDTGCTENKIKIYLKKYDDVFKKPLTKMLMEYYKVKFNPELNFEGDLLERLGFKPCYQCHSLLDI